MLLLVEPLPLRCEGFSVHLIRLCLHHVGFPGGSMGKKLPANAGDMGSAPGSARFPGEGNGKSLQYSCLGNPMDRGACQATVHGVTQSQTRLNTHTGR